MAWEDLPESTRSRLEDLFDYSPRSLGTIASPNLDGLLILANEGVEVWNAWAESNPNFHVDFSRHTFTEPTSFSGFIFPSGSKGRASFNKSVFQKPIDFSSCTFPQRTSFEGANFLGEISLKECKFKEVEFSGCEFSAPAHFENSIFSGGAKFNNVKFGAWTSFEGSEFLEYVSLHSIEANGDISFEQCRFSKACDIRSSNGRGNINFSYSEFLDEFRFVRMKNFGVISNEAKFNKQVTFWKNETSGVKFSSSNFISKALFIETKFEGENFFDECRFEKLTSFRSSEFPDAVEFDLSEFKDILNFSCPPDDSDPKKPKDLKYISFSGCQFHGAAKFDNRNFTSRSRFSKKEEGNTTTATTFHKAPTFHGCKFHQDITFHGSDFIQDYGDTAARAYRTLKLASEQLKATRDEQRFFQLEMKAEKPSLAGWKRLVSSAYERLADYGFSLGRPLKYWLLFLLLFGGIHGWLANKALGANWTGAATPQFENLLSNRTQQTFQYILINAIPAPGLDRKSSALRENLFSPKGSPGWIASLAILVEMLHKAGTLACLFLIGLSIRNLLKMKS
jgi:uncharacterized protein YjbI with pentapeptide repeats